MITFLSRLLFLASCLFVFGCASGKRTFVRGMNKSCNAYFVRGSWHYPQNFYEYNQVGLASWYGPGFHGKPTAHGALYNQHAFTAAHKTLPLPTVVKVTNLSNRKSIVLVVNDRGPFHYKGRIIDLSYIAAKKIGLYEKGITTVRVESLVEESQKLSDYLARFPKAKDRGGKTWDETYFHHIAYQPYSSFSVSSADQWSSFQLEPKKKKAKVVISR